MAKKIFVIDTNVLMDDPSAIYGFEDNDVFITGTVQQELDHHKKDIGESGYNVRTAIRTIDNIASEYPLDVTEFALENSGILVLYKGADKCTLPGNFDFSVPDNRIFNDILDIKRKNQDKEIILVTNDVSMRINARSLGIKAQPYKNAQIVTDEKYTGRGTLVVADEVIKGLKQQLEMIDSTKYMEFGANIPVFDDIETHENQYLVLIGENSEEKVAAQYREGRFYPINLNLHPMNIKQRNIGQGFALHALMSPVETIPLVILEGRAGTAKTFLSLACGMDAVYDTKGRGKNASGYTKLVFTRPNQLSDRDHGFLKGDLFDKMTPLLGPAFDNLEQLIAGETGEEPEQVRYQVDDMFESGMIEAMSMAYMRGRSISDAYLIVDEAQNCTRGQIYDIISRAGTGTKVVLCGDSNQIDNPVLDRRNNGLVFAIDRMKDSKLCAQVTFDGEGECVRSALAAEATRLLSK